MDKTTEAKIFSASVDEDAPLKPFLSEADSQKHGALNHQVWKTVKFSSKIIESREKTMSDFITQTRLSLRLESYLREYVGKHDDKPPFSTREWDEAWQRADQARTQNALTPELVENVRIALQKL